MSRARLLVAVVAAALLLVLGESFGYVRAVVAIAMFLAIAYFGIRFMQFVVAAPPDPEKVDVRGHGLKYVCTMCGLELRVEVAARTKPPTHCMEPMVLVHEGERPPLRPVPDE